MTALRTRSLLPGQLGELVRLRVAFHTQYRSCMVIRYSTGVDDGLDEELVYSPEKAARALADRRTTCAWTTRTSPDCASNSASTSLKLCFQVATFDGYGRMGAMLAMTDDLPEYYADPDAVLAPWLQAPVSRV